MSSDQKLPIFAQSIVAWQPPDDESVAPKPSWQTEDGEFHVTAPAEPARPMCNEQCQWFRPKEVDIALARLNGDRGPVWLAKSSCTRPEYEQMARHHIEPCWPVFEALWRRSFSQEASHVPQ